MTTARGEKLRRHLPALGQLRIDVFRAWPYLYEGDPLYEQRYLETYIQSPGAAVVLACADDAVVGASTCLPLEEENATVQAPFTARGLDLKRFCYFGESVLLAPWRGQGIGVEFFRQREAHARGLGVDYACFCAVARADDHPARPRDAKPLNAFWHKRGFTALPGFNCTMNWKEIGADDEAEHELCFWFKPLHEGLPPCPC